MSSRLASRHPTSAAFAMTRQRFLTCLDIAVPVFSKQSYIAVLAKPLFVVFIVIFQVVEGEPFLAFPTQFFLLADRPANLAMGVSVFLGNFRITASAAIDRKGVTRDVGMRSNDIFPVGYTSLRNTP